MTWTVIQKVSLLIVHIYVQCSEQLQSGSRTQSCFISIKHHRRCAVCAKMPTMTWYYNILLKWGSTSSSVVRMHAGAYLFSLHINLFFHMVKLPLMWRLHKQQRVKPIRDAIIFTGREHRILLSWDSNNVIAMPLSNSHSWVYFCNNIFRTELNPKFCYRILVNALKAQMHILCHDF